MPRYFFHITVCISCLSVVIRVFSKIRILPQNSQLCRNVFFFFFLEIRSKLKNHHISEAGVSFEIQFGLCIKIWAGEHIFYIWQQTIALSCNMCFHGALLFLSDSTTCHGFVVDQGAYHGGSLGL